jgi:hypothetical protein
VLLEAVVEAADSLWTGIVGVCGSRAGLAVALVSRPV